VVLRNFLHIRETMLAKQFCKLVKL
jgi:hypothetical protein